MPRDLGPFEAAVSKFGATLQELLNTGITRQDIAERCGLQPSTVSRLINGSRQNAYVETVLRVAYAFDIEPAVMLPTLAELKLMVRSADAPQPDEG